MNYPYSETNRLEQPHAYMYTAFGGVDFLAAYHSSREKALARFKGLQGGPELDKNCRPLASFSTAESVNTGELLLSLLSAQSVREEKKEIKAWLDRLAQRFEVSKKLSETYLPGFRKGEGPTDCVRLYLLLSQALSLEYGATRELKFLSTLLKVNDLLCSLPDHQLANLPGPGLAAVLEAELSGVRQLAKEKEVSLGAS